MATMGSLLDEEFPVCCCRVTSSKPLPTQPLVKYTHIRLRRASKIFSQIFCLQHVGEGTLKDIKQRDGSGREERKNKINSARILPEIQPANGPAWLFLHLSSLSCLHIWIKNTPSIKQLTKERRYSSEESLKQKGSKNSRFEEYQYLHDQTGEVLKRRSLGKQLFK